MLTKGEGVARLEAERRLVKLFREEYERLSRNRGHIEAVRSLVRLHKTRYNAIVGEARERVRSAIAARQAGSTQAA